VGCYTLYVSKIYTRQHGITYQKWTSYTVLLVTTVGWIKFCLDCILISAENSWHTSVRHMKHQNQLVWNVLFGCHHWCCMNRKIAAWWSDITHTHTQPSLCHCETRGRTDLPWVASPWSNWFWNPRPVVRNWMNNSTGGADKSLARPGRKQATAKEDFDVHICYLWS